MVDFYLLVGNSCEVGSLHRKRRAGSNAPYAEETLAPSSERAEQPAMGGGKIRPELTYRATVVNESKRC
jgi:hypothetical protein